MTDVRARWPLADRPALRDRLLAAYGDPRRRYHDLRHLAEVLERLDLLLPEATESVDADAVRLAAWFHDAVYDGSADDEERSALLAEQALAAAALPERLVAEVARLVRLTSTHLPAPGDANGDVLCDADLGILGAAPERYDEYAAAVRQEYGSVPEPAFRAGRAAVLRRLAAGQSLFRTGYARRHWEAAARANIARELRVLDA